MTQDEILREILTVLRRIERDQQETLHEIFETVSGEPRKTSVADGGALDFLSARRRSRRVTNPSHAAAP